MNQIHDSGCKLSPHYYQELNTYSNTFEEMIQLAWTNLTIIVHPKEGCSRQRGHGEHGNIHSESGGRRVFTSNDER